MSKTKKIEKAVIILSTKEGDVAKAKVPGQCYLANDGKKQGFGAPKVTAKDVRVTLREDHDLVQKGIFEAGTRLIIPTPSTLAYYIGNVEQGLSVGDTMVATEDASFELNVLDPQVKIVRPEKVGPQGGVRGDRSEETRRAQKNPQRKIQDRNKHQRYAIRVKNAELLRVGKPAMTFAETEEYLRSLGL